MTTQTLITQTQADFDPIVSLVVDGLTSEHSRRAYGRALGDFLSWYAGQAVAVKQEKRG